MSLIKFFRFLPAVVILCSLSGATAWSQDANVDPLTLVSPQAIDQVVALPLSIGNVSPTGTPDLVWAIFEDISGFVRGPIWSDNFDSYATGSQLHGQGGWKGWFNNPASGALTSAAQARSVPNSAEIGGASDLVHEYAGSTSGQWIYTAWQFIPTGFSGTTYFILLNQYDDAGVTLNWSTQIQFDSTSSLVTNDGPAGGTLPLVLDAWVEIRVEIDLALDTQAFYYDNQLLFQGSWTDGNSGGGALNIAAVDLFANAATPVYYDDFSLTQVICDAPDDIPWLSVSPAAGTTPPSGTSPVDVTFDSTGMTPGIYTANLCVTSNDPDPGPGNGTDLVIVPVTMDLVIPVELMRFSVE